MAWPALLMETWNDLTGLASISLAGNSAFKAQFLFRGQSRAEWGLRSSLQRIIAAEVPAAEALRIEDLSRSYFADQAHLVIDVRLLPGEQDLFNWWALMQHHGAPTRLLDWTKSLYVAAYFACVDDWGYDGAIWMVHAGALVEHHDLQPKEGKPLREIFSLPDAPEMLLPLESTRKSERMIAQQGQFTVCARILGDQAEIIDSILGPEDTLGTSLPYAKLRIPAKGKPDILHRLRNMNLTASSLFPGVDGLGRSISEAARLEALMYRRQWLREAEDRPPASLLDVNSSANAH